MRCKPFRPQTKRTSSKLPRNATARHERERRMTPSTLMFTLVGLVMMRAVFGWYLGGEYVCPVCGSRDENEHTDECPWKSR